MLEYLNFLAKFMATVIDLQNQRKQRRKIKINDKSHDINLMPIHTRSQLPSEVVIIVEIF